ncbi:LRR domain containing protein [Parasponia andersonii]|uniref:LRR domain containing protein n=1 Tax=Parasponia andersonii TaxID=3476 RepID=A0A2P5CQ84_PARAD|nr:LRR domain containing protein [Parasponia andersonii]
MQFLSFGTNSLSGEIPKKVGQLTELISLSFEASNFFGPLSSELWNLSKLQQLALLSVLNCLQRNCRVNFPCNQGSPI